MLKLLRFILMLWLACFSAWGQSRLDSLLYVYEEQIGSEKIATGIRISSYYDNDNLFKSLGYAKEVLAFANEFGTNHDAMVAHNRLGIVFYKLGDLAQSNQHFLQALDLLTHANESDLSYESRLMNNIANNYSELKQEALAVEYYKKSLAIKEQMKDSSRLSVTLNNLALTYNSIQLFDSAFYALHRALRIDMALKDSVSQAYTKGSLGEIFLDSGQTDSAYVYLSEALQFFSKIPDSDYVLAYFHEKLGETTLKKSDYDASNGHFKLALEYAITIGAKPIQRDCYQGLQLVAEQVGDFAKALEYSRLYNQLQDSLFKAESAQKLSAIETSYQIKNKEQEISILNAKAETDQYKFYGAATMALFVLILLGIIYSRYLFKVRANQALEQKNKTIQQQNKEIMDGVEYAKGIQEAILPDFNTIKPWFSNAYLYYRPSQVVSGDFYWVEKINDTIILVLADGTGHGVPGAFLSVMGTSLLKQIISEDKICKPDEVLNELNKKVRDGLGQSRITSTLKDGMDVAVCTYNLAKGKLFFAGAKRPLILKKGNEISLIKGSRFSVGGNKNGDVKFDLHEFDIAKTDSIILFTDGVIDQFGGPDNKKYLAKRLLNFVKEGQGIEKLISGFDIEMENWQHHHEQTDDMLLLAVEI